MSARRGRRPAPLYLAHVVPGLEELAWDELEERVASLRRVATWSGFDRRAGALLFRTDEPLRSLLSLRMVEDAFAVVAQTRRLPDGRAALQELARLATSGDTETALRLHRESVPAKPKRRPTFRVVARVAGRQAYRRADAQRACERALAARFPRWRLVEDGAALEFWLQVVGQEAALALRLSAPAMRQRGDREVSLPKALKPTVAHALARLARPERNGWLLDPMCGSGTLLIEADSLGIRAVGGDANRPALRAARANAWRAGVVRWDATRLPLRDGSVGGLVCNLPWRGETNELSALYHRVVREAARAVSPSGRIVLLTAQPALLDRPAREHRLVVEQRVRVVVRGAGAWIVVLRQPD